MRDLEHRLQTDCVRWFGYAHPELRGLLVAVPNGGRRDSVTGARLKAEGVVAGVADLILFAKRGGHGALMLEMKTAKGRQSEAQKEWQGRVEGAGYRYEVVRDFERFATVIEEYLNSK
ncbi:MAG: VRR-NUC domain-containing protein [Pseudoflavonifractor sp.]|nr:VRR-NUC domain-containing protein [Alloprevotella sp.]MCM1117627.1 VRR-NUC domain-containing protein [Pseudoflavonifractor sp.]